MARIGADIGQLEALGKAFATKASDVQQLTTSITSQVASTDWEGPAASKFKSDWDSIFKPNLQKLQTALEELSKEVKARRDAIERAGS